MFSWNSLDASPTDQRRVPGFGNHRKALAVLGNDDHGPPPMNHSTPHLNTSYGDYFQHDPQSNLQWSPKNEGHGTFFHDYSEHEASPATATFRPGTDRTFPSEPSDFDYDRDHRRPSAASAGTVSSQGSKSSASGLFRKKLQGFFGDDYNPGDQRHNSDDYQITGAKPSSLEQFKARQRADSEGSRRAFDRPQDEGQQQIRPRTPLPSSDITPWEYQGSDVRLNSMSVQLNLQDPGYTPNW